MNVFTALTIAVLGFYLFITMVFYRKDITEYLRQRERTKRRKMILEEAKINERDSN